MTSGRVLLTGGAGFIGSHTARLLASRGYEVTVLDNLSTGARERIPRGIQLVEGDVLNKDTVEKLVRKTDYIVHLAAIVSVDEAREKPLETLRVNVLGTLNVLEAAVKAGVEKLVYASSCSVYGETRPGPIDEDTPPKPTNTYAASKLAGEALVNAYMHERGLKAVILRYFNVYGPGMRGGPYAGVVYKFITRALKGEPLIIYGDGNQTRDFVYVEDVAEANLKALEASVTGTFNIGTGKPTTINKLAELILRLTNSRSPIAHTDPRPGDIRHSVADTRRAEEILGWKPRTDLKTGLEKTIKEISKASA